MSSPVFPIIPFLWKLNIQKTNKQTKYPFNQKMGRGPNRQFSKEGIQMAKRHKKRWSTSLIFREMQIKMTKRHRLILVRISIAKKSISSTSQWGRGDRETLLPCWWECRLIPPLWRAVQRLLNKPNWTVLWPSDPIPGHTRWGNHHSKGPARLLSHFSRVWFFETPWTVTYQASLLMGFSRQEYWSGLPFPPPFKRIHAP